MADKANALGGAEFEGYARVHEEALRGMVLVKGDLDSTDMSTAFKTAVGLDLPATRRVASHGERHVLWMAPDEVLLLCPDADAAEATRALESALSGQHALVVDMSDARAEFVVTGQSVREVLAKLTPADMAAEAFVPGDIRRTRVAQSPAAIWLVSDTEARVFCFRSVAQYMFDVLSESARPGSEVLA